VTYDGWGHGDYDRSACIDDITDQYLINKVMPAKGVHCAAVPPANSAATFAPTPPKAAF
jgi:hypothetical protein